MSGISPINAIIDEARNGRPFILVDADDRENEGDIIVPAQFATPDRINMMATHARGLICLAPRLCSPCQRAGLWHWRPDIEGHRCRCDDLADLEHAQDGSA